jgi:hypothetical protein
MLFATIALLCTPAVTPTAPRTTESSVYAIRARTLHVGQGETIEDGTVVIEGGKIRAVGKNVPIPAGAAVIEHDGPLSAGLIALHGYDGTRASSPVVARGFNPFGQAELAEEWRTHVHGHAEIEEEAEEVIVDRGEEVVGEDTPEHGEADEADEDGHGQGKLEHEHGQTGGPEPAEQAAVEPIVEPGLFASREVAVDSTRAVIPEAELAHAFNPNSPDFRRALEAGITTLVLTPNPTNLVSGQTAVVKTSGGVLTRNAHLSLGFRSGALRANRYPTSYSGAVAELEERFTEPEGAFAQAASGKLPVMFEVSGRQDVLRAAAFAQRHALKGAVSGAPRVGEVVEAVKAANLSAVVGPFPIGTDGRYLRSVVALAKANVSFGFGLNAPMYDPSLLRLSAASCVGQGLDPAVALSALTDTAARIAGVDKKVGKLAAGMDADLVLWSGHPLDLASRAETVIVDGQILVGGAR